ncbi:MAG: response regulator [Saccharofermentanales bacterium]
MNNIFKKINKEQIIIIDDNKYYAELIKANIYKIGYKNTKIFNNGEDSIEYIKKNKPKCVILDHILSSNGFNGDDVLKKIKKIDNKINVIIISGQEDVKIATELMKLGAFDYIIKNEDMTFFNLENSLRKLNRILIINNNKILTYSILILSLLFVSLFLYLFL